MGTPFVLAKIPGTRMMKVRERKFFSKPCRYLRPLRRRLRFAVWLQVASAVFAGPTHLGNGGSRACSAVLLHLFIQPRSSQRCRIRTTGCATSRLVSASRYIETAANCPRNRCFLSLFSQPSKRGVSVFIPRGSSYLRRSLRPDSKDGPKSRSSASCQ